MSAKLLAIPSTSTGLLSFAAGDDDAGLNNVDVMVVMMAVAAARMALLMAMLTATQKRSSLLAMLLTARFSLIRSRMTMIQMASLMICGLGVRPTMKMAG